MEKLKKMLSFAKILSVFIIFVLFGTSAFFCVNYFFTLKGISDLKEQNQDLKNLIYNMNRDQTDNNDSEPTSNDIDQTGPEIKDASVIWAKDESNIINYLESIRENTSMPFYYIKDAELVSDITLDYNVLYEDIVDNTAKDLFYYYNTASLNFVQQYGQLKVSILSGMFYTGGSCTDQYYLDTKLDGNEVHVCVGVDSSNNTDVSFDLKFDEKTKYFESTIIRLHLMDENVPEKEDLEELVKNLERVN